MYSVISLIIVVISISLIAVWLDQFVLRGGMATWRHDVTLVWLEMNEGSQETLTSNANKIFCDLFDDLYGKSFFSFKRFLSSFVSTTLSLILFTFIIGYYQTIWPSLVEMIAYALRVASISVTDRITDWSEALEIQYFSVFNLFILAAAIPVALNYIPDFISLMETRFVLSISRGRRSLAILMLIILDLLATTLIFMAGLAVLVGIFDGIDATVQLFLNEPFWLITMILDPGLGLPFFLTTFVTSFLWIMFAVVFVIIRVFHRYVPGTNYFLFTVAVSNHPILIVSSILIFVVILAYLCVILFVAVAG